MSLCRRSIAFRCGSSFTAIRREHPFYDPTSQRTLRKTDEIYIHPVRETILTEETSCASGCSKSAIWRFIRRRERAMCSSRSSPAPTSSASSR